MNCIRTWAILTLIEAFGSPLVFLAPAREATLQFVAAHGTCGR